MADFSSNIEVCLNSKEGNVPSCQHGPALLFRRLREKQKRWFYACSASRDRKQCSFFQWKDDQVSEARLKARKREYGEKADLTEEHKLKYARFDHNFEKSPNKRQFCHDCQLLLLDSELSSHTSHKVIKGISTDQLLRPTMLLQPLENNKTNAQYLFSTKTVEVVLDWLKDLNIHHVVCVGTPRIHEFICSQTHKKSDSTGSSTKSLLLDMDHRLQQFYDSSTFCRYNMFNHHFFGGDASKENFLQFVRTAKSLALIIDPPFGGMVNVLAHTINKIINDCMKSEVSIFWFFPYFHELKISSALPQLSMSDYQVEYENHDRFKGMSQGQKQGSIVRVFTNVDLAQVRLPLQEGYRWCEKCRKYVAPANQHCSKCKSCTSKDGRPYSHCDKCLRCVKASYSHCGDCSHCHLSQRSCKARDDEQSNSSRLRTSGKTIKRQRQFGGVKAQLNSESELPPRKKKR